MQSYSKGHDVYENRYLHGLHHFLKQSYSLETLFLGPFSSPAASVCYSYASRQLSVLGDESLFEYSNYFFLYTWADYPILFLTDFSLPIPM